MWRRAVEADDGEVIPLCLTLNAEDPGPAPVLAAQIERTLQTFRRQPDRGMAVALDIDEKVVGYAFLVSFWSNELGGEVCVIDELYVAPDSGAVDTPPLSSINWPRSVVDRSSRRASR